MSELDSFWVKMVETITKTAKSHDGSLKGDLWPKLVTRDGKTDLRKWFWGSRG